MVARRVSRFIRSLPRDRKPVPQSRMIVCSPALTSTQLVLPPNRIWVDDGQGIVPRTPQKVAVSAMANRCWLKDPKDRLPPFGQPHSDADHSFSQPAKTSQLKPTRTDLDQPWMLDACIASSITAGSMKRPARKPKT